MTDQPKKTFEDLSARKLLAELLGAYVLVLVGATAILASLGAYQGIDIVMLAFGFGLALLDGRMGFALMIQYWVAQIIGAILAGFTLAAATSREAVGQTATTFGDLEVWEAFVFEAVFTAIFVVVILKVTASPAQSTTVFLAISLTLVAIHLALVPITGASVNPARSLGSGVAGDVWTDQWVYWVAPLVGAIIGWGVHKAATMDMR